MKFRTLFFGVLPLIAYGCKSRSSAGIPDELIPGVPVVELAAADSSIRLALGPADLRNLSISQIGKSVQTPTGAKRAKGTFWRLSYELTNSVQRPLFAVPSLVAVDDKSKTYPCALDTCDAAALNALPAGKSRTEEVFFDLPEGRRPISISALAARPEGGARPASWPTGVSAPPPPRYVPKPKAPLPEADSDDGE